MAPAWLVSSMQAPQLLWLVLRAAGPTAQASIARRTANLVLGGSTVIQLASLSLQDTAVEGTPAEPKTHYDFTKNLHNYVHFNQRKLSARLTHNERILSKPSHPPTPRPPSCGGNMDSVSIINIFEVS